MARLRYNGLATGSAGSIVGLTLGASLTSGATSVTFSAALTYANGTAVPTITGTDYIPLSILDTNGRLSEVVYLTAYTAAATTGTITRGQEGTTGVAHASGDKVIQPPLVGDDGAWSRVINDDLSSTTNMLATLAGTWAITGGVLRGSGAFAHISHATAVTPAAIRAVEVECAYISGATTNARMGLIVSSSNVTTGNLIVYAESSNGTTWVVKVEADAAVLMLTTATISYTGTGYMRLGVIQSGSMFDVYLGGVWLGTVNAISSSQFVAGKYVGLYSNALTADFRNLKAYSRLSSPF